MKICIPTADDRGLDARLFDHFGSAPYFTLFETGTGDLAVMANAGKVHEHGQCDPSEAVQAQAAEVVVCRGLGRRALDRLQSIGVEVFVTQEATARRAIEANEAGRLDAMTHERECDGQGDCDHHDPAKS
jgi:predicted Fe-Mo cluster-binding NifX family protein